MAKKTEQPKINQVYMVYNGNQKAFEIFMASMIKDYLDNSEDKLPKTDPHKFVIKVENSVKS